MKQDLATVRLRHSPNVLTGKLHIPEVLQASVRREARYLNRFWWKTDDFLRRLDLAVAMFNDCRTQVWRLMVEWFL